MSGKPFDATLKDLIEGDPVAWAARFCPGPVLGASLVDADASTVTAAADKVLRVRQPGGECIVNLEMEARHAGDAPDRLLLYSAVLSNRHELPVRSVVLLMRPEANATAVTGLLEKRHEGEDQPYLTFRYHVVRVWEQSAGTLLAGPPSFLPLAPLTNDAVDDLAGVVTRAIHRMRAETSPDRSDKLERALFGLLDLRFEVDTINQLFLELQKMENTAVYRAVARITNRETILKMGRKKFGEPTAAQTEVIEQISDLPKLESLMLRLLDVSTWDELLAEEAP